MLVTIQGPQPNLVQDLINNNNNYYSTYKILHATSMVGPLYLGLV